MRLLLSGRPARNVLETLTANLNRSIPIEDLLDSRSMHDCGHAEHEHSEANAQHYTSTNALLNDEW
jgi:hypothetical protein